MARAHLVTPYWERLPRFLLYPLQPPAIWLVLAVAAVGAIVAQGGLLGMIAPLIMLAVLFVVLRYGYEVLSRTAENDVTPPPASADVLLSGYELPLKQFAIIVCGLVAALYSGQLLNAFIAMAINLAVYALIPASVIVLAWTRSFLTALNPAMLIQLVLAMRWHYAALFGLLFVIGQAPNYFYAFLPPGMPVLPAVFIGLAAEFYFLLVLFHLMGYFLLQFGPELGIETAEPPDEASKADEDYSLFEQLLERGDYSAALAQIREIASRWPEQTSVQQRLHRTAQLVQDHTVMARGADQLIAHHLAAGREDEAANVAAETLDQMPNYRPQRAELFLGLARGLRRQGHIRAAVTICNGFHKHFPDHGDIPELYGLIARIFREDLGQENQYAALCQFLKQQYPDHPTTISVTAFHREGG